MDGSRFDSLTKHFASTLTRRSSVGGILATLLAPLSGLGSVPARAQPDQRPPRDQRAKPEADQVEAEACLRDGKRCGKRRGKDNNKEFPSCKKCCSRRAVKETNGRRRRCRCRPDGRTCRKNHECCTNQCQGGTCGPATPACDVCADGCAFTTVQDAIDAATAGDTVRLCAETYVGGITIDKNLDLVGAGRNDTILDGGNAGSTVVLAPGITVDIRFLTITGGDSAGVGGGISNDSATTTLTNVNVTDNVAGSRGGGIDINAGGLVTLINSDVSGNDAVDFGAGIFALGAVELVNSTVTDNIAGDEGGGIFTETGGSTTIDADSSVTNNDPDNCAGPGTVTGTCTNP